MAQGMGPQAGSKSIALKFGRGVDYSDISYSQINNLSTSSTLSTPYTLADSNYGNNDVTNIIGIEAKYFVASNIAVSVSGSGVISNSPAQDLVEGYNNGDVAGSDIPTYNHVTGRSTKQFYVNLGGNYYFNVGSNRVFPYAGAEFNSVYGHMQVFDGYKGASNLDFFEPRNGEFYALGASAVGGIDYFVSEGLFIGLDIRVASYMYNVKSLVLQPGLEPQQAVTHNTSFFSYPSFKLGFMF